MTVLEFWLNQQWYQSKKPNILLRFLSIIYSFALRFQKAQNTEKLSVPVVVVGNFTVGGTGKTPLIIALAEQLKQKGYKPGVVSRGYGRQMKLPVLVNANTNASEAGDEPLLVFQRTGVPVQVDSDRCRAAMFLIQQGCTIILSDDGLQHRNLPRDIEIEVIDCQRGYGNSLLLPAGPLREPVRPVSLQVSNGSLIDNGNCYAMQLVVNHCYPLDGHMQKSLHDFSGQSVFALAGIGNPERFFSALKQFNILVDGKALPDHHAMALADFPEHGTVFITEKDAVKCKGMKRDNVWVVSAVAKLSDSFFVEFFKQLQIIALRKYD
jgi:tetraacyldisaccharide 4'-kinase